MTPEQYNNLISEIKILNTKLKFVEDDLQEIKDFLAKLYGAEQEPQPQAPQNYRVEKF
jgi:hypothetical protein